MRINLTKTFKKLGLQKSKKELKKFILSGITTVIIDFIAYVIFINLGINITFSKATSFLLGTLYSYFINKNWTFKAIGGLKVFMKFLLIYFFSLNINFSVNRIIVNNFDNKNLFIIVFAFFVSTMMSAIFNFLFLKNFVFKKRI